MPTKKKKYNARFPAGRIKKIMQTDEEVGKVAQAVPIIISRTLELFVESLLRKAMEITSAKNAKTLSPSHMKQCILSESRFDFLKDLVKNLPDVSSCDGEEGTSQYLSSPPSSANSSINQEVSVSSVAARLPSEQRTPRLSTEEQPVCLPPQLLPVQPVPTVTASQLQPNFYKETDGASPSYGQVAVASEITTGRSSVLCVNPVSSPKPASAVVSTVSAVKRDSSGVILHRPAATIIPTKTEGSDIGDFHHKPIVIPQSIKTEPALALDKTEGANIGAFHHKPIVIPQYIKTEPALSLDDDTDGT